MFCRVVRRELGCVLGFEGSSSVFFVYFLFSCVVIEVYFVFGRDVLGRGGFGFFGKLSSRSRLLAMLVFSV